MRVKSPVGDYDYRVTGVRLGREGLELDGSLGQWQTTMVVEPKDVAKALAVLVPLVVLVTRRR
jgi:hypothetical protein